MNDDVLRQGETRQKPKDCIACLLDVGCCVTRQRLRTMVWRAIGFFLVWFEDRLRPTAGGGGKVPD